MPSLRISQGAYIVLSSTINPKVQISQVALIVLVNSYVAIPTPPVIKLPCQSNCLQFFDLRK